MGLFGIMLGDIECVRAEILKNQAHGVHLVSKTRARLLEPTIKENKLGVSAIVEGSILSIDGRIVK